MSKNTESELMKYSEKTFEDIKLILQLRQGNKS